MEKNIQEDQAALKELIALGYRATPITIIDGETVVGFDQARIEKLLNL